MRARERHHSLGGSFELREDSLAIREIYSHNAKHALPFASFCRKGSAVRLQVFGPGDLQVFGPIGAGIKRASIYTA